MNRRITIKEWFIIIASFIIFSCLSSAWTINEIRKYASPSSVTVRSDSKEVAKLLIENPPGQIIHLLFKVTAYCPCKICCGRFADGVTASNYLIQPGDKFVAACPILFDFGDIMDIPGYGIVEVKDRGGKIKDFHIDVFFHTHQEAKNWGIQYLEVGMFLNDI